MRVAVLGTGALGCVFASHLSEHAEVWMLGTWAEGIAAVRREGIRVWEKDGPVRHARVEATSDPGAAPPADIALVLVKSYQTERAAAWAARVLSRSPLGRSSLTETSGLAVTLQNGLDNGQKLAAAVGPARTATGVTYLGATLLGPGQVRLAARQPTYVGLNPAGADSQTGRGWPRPNADDFEVPMPFRGTDLVQALVSLLNCAGLEARITPDVQSLLWGKAVANAAINPLTALWRVPNGELLATPERRELLAALAREGAAVARGRGIALPFEDPVEHVASVCEATAGNRSSMLQDAERGRPTEVDSINGVIVAEGKRLGIPTPVNDVVWRLVRGIASCPVSRVA